MKAARFSLMRPRDLAEALSILADSGEAAKIMAGGQSLGPMLNLRLVEPEVVVDISGLLELRRFERTERGLSIGACVTHADIEDGRVPDVANGMLVKVAGGIAYRAVRNRGTVGGSLSHADPAADWVSAMSVLGAEVDVVSKGGARRVMLGALLRGALDVALSPAELVRSIHIEAPPASARWGYAKHCRKVGEFAHAIGAVLIDPKAGRGRLVIGAVEAPPIVIEDARALFGGSIGPAFASNFDPDAADAALQAAGLSDAVDRHVHITVLWRAILQAAGHPAAPLRHAA